jgi:hypothetical protein
MSPKLQIEVREAVRRLVVTMPGTRYSMEFADNNGRLGLMSGFGQNDKRVSLTAREFAVLAEKAALPINDSMNSPIHPGLEPCLMELSERHEVRLCGGIRAITV